MADPKAPLLTVSGQQFIIGGSIVMLWVGVMLVLAFIPIPDSNRDAFNLFLGGILGAGTTVLAFYFPSSVGARSKDEAIVKVTDALARTAPPSTTTTTTTTGAPEPTP